MEYSYPVEVDCANCANLMERAAGKVRGVEKVSVNFMAQKMHITFLPGFTPDDVMPLVEKACKRAEPDCHILYR